MSSPIEKPSRHEESSPGTADDAPRDLGFSDTNEESTRLPQEVDNLIFDDKCSFSEELRKHSKSVVWPFKYAVAVTKKTLENIHAYQSKMDKELQHVSPTKSVEDQTFSELSTFTTKCCDHSTPHSQRNVVTSYNKSKGKNFEEVATTSNRRPNPLPTLSWADSNKVWNSMINKEEATLKTRNSRLFEDRLSNLPRMRAILVEWLMEVSEVYHLRRVTYYLAVDYLDRYLTIKPDIPRSQLQLVGITALFIAAKTEEIYAPKVGEFSYVCDGACSEAEILACEALLINSLGWDISRMTPSSWLNLYMQIHYNADAFGKQMIQEGVNNDFQFPIYSGYQFVRASHLIDLFSLDPGFLHFSYSIIAAGAMYFTFGKVVALRVSGLTWEQLVHCVEYMAVFHLVLRDAHDPKLESVPHFESDERLTATLCMLRKKVPNIITDENHAIQTHAINLEYFEQATILRLKRMGLRVHKKYIKKQKIMEDLRSRPHDETNTIQTEPVTTEESTVSPGNEDDSSSIVMFDIERVSDAVTTTNKMPHVNPTSHCDKSKENPSPAISSCPSSDSLKQSNDQLQFMHCLLNIKCSKLPHICAIESEYTTPNQIPISKESSCCPSGSSVPNDADVFTKDIPSMFTFDEILLGINDCSNRKIPQRKVHKSDFQEQYYSAED